MSWVRQRKWRFLEQRLMSENVLLIRNVAPDKFGGGETYQIELGQMLLRHGLMPVVVTASRRLLKEAKNAGMKVAKAPYIERQDWSGWKNLLLPIYVFKQWKLKRWYRGIFLKYQPMVINVQSKDEWIAATIAAKKMGVPVVWTDHIDLRTWVLQNVKTFGKNFIGKWVLRCAKKADKIVMISDFERKHFERVAGKMRNVVTIKNGVEDRRDSYRDIEAKKNSFCYVGRIIGYKGIGELLEAFKIVQQRESSAVLNIYGDGPDMKKYKKIAESIPNVKFNGYTSEPLRAMAENEIFVLPSYYEGLSISLLDAAMMGKIIIASDVDGNPEVVKDGETGFLVPAKNADRLAEAMLVALEREKVKNLAKKARGYYKENFDFERVVAEKMLPMYNEIKVSDNLRKGK